MADQKDDDLELGDNLSMDEEHKDLADGKKIKKWGMIILVAVSVILLAGGFWFVFGGQASSGELKINQPKVKDNLVAVSKNKKPAKYFAFGSDFVVNIGNESQHNLVASLSIMTRDEATYEALKKHKPLIRNGLIELFETYQYEQLQSQQGKLALRKKSLLAVKDVLLKVGEEHQIEAVFFTNFMMD